MEGGSVSHRRTARRELVRVLREYCGQATFSR